VARDQASPKAQADIDALLGENRQSRSRAEEWASMNAASQYIGQWLLAPQLQAEYQTLLNRPEAKLLPGYDKFEEDKALLDGTATNIETQRAKYGALLYAVQGVYVDRRFQRILRRQTAVRLLFFGIGTAVATLAAPAIYLSFYLFSKWGWPLQPRTLAEFVPYNEPAFGLVLAASLGALGAYFSRILNFQGQQSSLAFDEALRQFSNSMLLLRLLYGGIGAVIFYYLLRSGLVGGLAFPDIAIAPLDGSKSTGASVVGNSLLGLFRELTVNGHRVLSPTPALAKLIIWCFLAGFSERLVPDSLSRVEARASEKPA
jgi:hypothetical protein